MKTRTRLIIAGLLFGLPVGFANAGIQQCPQTEAWGGGTTTTQIDNVKVVQITCNACYGCVTAEGDPDADCNTECDPATEPPPDGYVTPTLIVYVWNAETLHWDVQSASGSCQQMTTVTCLN
jgi:hypothetical protein